MTLIPLHCFDYSLLSFIARLVVSVHHRPENRPWELLVIKRACKYLLLEDAQSSFRYLSLSLIHTYYTRWKPQLSFSSVNTKKFKYFEYNLSLVTDNHCLWRPRYLILNESEREIELRLFTQVVLQRLAWPTRMRAKSDVQETLD